MKITYIYGLLIIKVSTDLICECTKVNKTKLNTLESLPDQKNEVPLDVNNKQLENADKGVKNDELNGKNKDKPATKSSKKKGKLKRVKKFGKKLKSRLLDAAYNNKNDKKKKNKNKEKEPKDKKHKPADKVPKETNEVPGSGNELNKNADEKKPFNSEPKKNETPDKPAKNKDKVKKKKTVGTKVMKAFKKPVKKLRKAGKKSKKWVKEKVPLFLEVGNELSTPRGSKSDSELMNILMNTPVKKNKPKEVTPDLVTKATGPFLGSTTALSEAPEAGPKVKKGKPARRDVIDHLLSGLSHDYMSLKESEAPEQPKNVEKKTKKTTPSDSLSLEDALGDFGTDSEDLDDSESKKNETPGTEESKEPKGSTKLEDISPAKKTEFKEKLVDENTTMDQEFKKELGDGEFEGKINYFKGREKTKEGGSVSQERTVYIPRDPSEDWNNSGLAASLRYLGSGYDIVFGNPLGDPVVMMDQGYRNPVIKLNWDVEYLNKDGANLKEPHGSWVRPEFSCRQAETIDHINTVEDFKKELSVDAQASYGIPYFFSFSASTGYKNFVQSTATNKVRTYITKTYCLRYVAGIVNYHALETTEEFKKAISNLPEYFDSEACTLELFKSNEDDPMCVNTVKPWVQFIKMFGTHFTTIVHLGGKITHQIQINKSDVLSMQQTGVNVDMAVKAVISPGLLDSLKGGLKTESDSQKRSESEHFKYEKQVLVIGGDSLVDSKDIDSLNNWSKDLYKKPMPIKVKLESIKSLLTNKRHRESFEEALKFYSETYGVSPDDIYKKYGKEFGVATLMLKGKQVVYSGNRSGSAVCPINTVIIMGFTLTILKRKNFIGDNEFTVHLSHCPVGEEKCVVSNEQGSESRIWAVCGEDTIPLLTQQTVVSLDEPASASCPAGYSIAFGFGFSIPKGNVVMSTDSYACRAGTASCVHKSSDNKATNAVWIACVENGAPQLTDITNSMVSTSSNKCSSKSSDNQYNDILCPVNSKLIAGWSMDFTESKNQTLNKMNTCSKNTPGCKVDKLMATEGQCRSHFSWISCLNEKDNTSEETNNTASSNNNSNNNTSVNTSNSNMNTSTNNGSTNNNKEQVTKKNVNNVLNKLKSSNTKSKPSNKNPLLM